MACLDRQFARVVWTLLLACPMYAQGPARMRGGPDRPPVEPAASPATAATPAATTPQPAVSPQPQAASSAAPVPPSMLQQPAKEAQVELTGNRLSIRADNSSLSGILQQVASKSGMTIDGLGSDERVFGTFGPGAPRDVLADLLNGTAYNVVLLGDLSDGAPRELILTPATHGAVVASAPPVNTAEEAEPEPEPPPPPQEVAPPGGPPPATPAVKTPQQLFEQLQRLRQAQQQGAQQPQEQQPQQPQQ